MHSFYPELQPLQPLCGALVISWLLLLYTLREQKVHSADKSEFCLCCNTSGIFVKLTPLPEKDKQCFYIH